MNILQKYYLAVETAYLKALENSNFFKKCRIFALKLDERNPEHEAFINELELEGRRLYRVEVMLNHFNKVEELLIKWGYKALEKFYPEKFKKIKHMFKDKSPFIRVDLIDILLNLKG